MHFTHMASDPVQRRPRSLPCSQLSLGKLVNGLRLLKNADSLTMEELNAETPAKAVVTKEPSVHGSLELDSCLFAALDSTAQSLTGRSLV